MARATSGGHTDALECSSGCIAGVQLLLNCITDSRSNAPKFGSDGLDGRDRLSGMNVMQLLTIMCSSSQNAVSVLAVDTLCQLVTLPAISLFSTPLITRSTRVYVNQLEAALKSVWGTAAIKTLQDAIVTADSRTAARSAALSLYTIYRDTWGCHWCVLSNTLLHLKFSCCVSSAGIRQLACWGAILHPSAFPSCLKLSLTRGSTSCPLECLTMKRAPQLLHRVVGVLGRFYKWRQPQSSLWYAAWCRFVQMIRFA